MISLYKVSTLQTTSYEGDIVASCMFIWTDESKRIGIVHIGSCGDINGHKTLSKEGAKSLYKSLRAKGASKVPSSDHLPDYQHTIQWLLERI